MYDKKWNHQSSYQQTHQGKKPPLKLLPHRKYVRKGNTMVRVRKQKDQPKLCKVISTTLFYEETGQSVHYSYDENRKILFPISYDQFVFVFPSKVQARKAIWHTVMQSGVPRSHVNYKIVEV